MKKYIFMTLTVVLFGLTACTEDAFDRINKDNEHPSPEAVPAALQLTDAIMSTGFSTVSGDFAFYLSQRTRGRYGKQPINVCRNAQLKRMGSFYDL